MKAGTEDKKKLAVLGVAGVAALGAVIYAYSQLFGSDTPATPPPVATAPSATTTTSTKSTKTGLNLDEKRVGTTAAALDPTLHMNAMLVTEALQYKGLGRNIFSSAPAAAVALPRALAPARPKAVAAVYTPPPGPPQPPPIDLRFFGTATRRGQQPRAFLLKGEDVYLASVGDIVQRRYKILAISANSITVQDLADSHQQALPLETN